MRLKAADRGKGMLYESLESSLPPRRRGRIHANAMDDRLRTLEDLLADVLFGAYWHDEYYRSLPAELMPWQLSLSSCLRPNEHQRS